jgi:hypothetical protein
LFRLQKALQQVRQQVLLAQRQPVLQLAVVLELQLVQLQLVLPL